MLQLPLVWQTALLLTASNVFMTFAWYAHLKHLNDRPWWIAALLSWGVALFVLFDLWGLFGGSSDQVAHAAHLGGWAVGQLWLRTDL